MIIYLCVNDVKYNIMLLLSLKHFKTNILKEKILNLKLFPDRGK